MYSNSINGGVSTRIRTLFSIFQTMEIAGPSDACSSLISEILCISNSYYQPNAYLFWLAARAETSSHKYSLILPNVRYNTRTRSITTASTTTDAGGDLDARGIPANREKATESKG